MLGTQRYRPFKFEKTMYKHQITSKSYFEYYQALLNIELTGRFSYCKREEIFYKYQNSSTKLLYYFIS